jgi:hypothetical protein
MKQRFELLGWTINLRVPYDPIFDYVGKTVFSENNPEE